MIYTVKVKTMSEESVETFDNSVGKMNDKDEPEFPDGLRVLLVDDSVVCLKIITFLLQNCRYQVTPKQNSAEALKLLKQNEDKFDIVLTNVGMDEINGFRILEVGLKVDIPVIMMSASENKEVIMKGIRHGARDFLLKPLRDIDVKLIWQHVYRKNLSLSSCPNHDHGDRKGKMGNKRKVEEAEMMTTTKRVRWDQPLHNKFVDVVQSLGGVDKAMPKKIVGMLGSPDITRQKVASHLQKYRKAIKKNSELDHQISHDGGGGGNNQINHHNNYLNHNHPPPPPPTPPMVRGVLVGLAMGGSNYSGYNPHYPLQVLPKLEGNNMLVCPNNSISMSDHHHQVQQRPLQHHYRDDDLMKGLYSLDCFESKSGVVDQNNNNIDPFVFDHSYDIELAMLNSEFFDGVRPPFLLDDINL